MKDRIIRAQNVIAIILLGLVFFLSAMVAALFLESEALVHGQVASGWYVHTLDALSINDIS